VTTQSRTEEVFVWEVKPGGVFAGDILADQVGHISIGAIQCLAVARASSTSSDARY